MSTYNPGRRHVLRSIALAGCALWLQRGIAQEGGAVKMPKAQAKYQDQPKGDQKCGGCTHFIPGSNSCRLVEGTISADGWCMLWAMK
jgi:hypothetical protein